MPDSTRFARTQQASLWDFALARYARPGVEAACLTLQDEAGVDVCELLAAAWAKSLNIPITPLAWQRLSAERRQWQAEMTEPLRSMRRRLKAEAAYDAGIQELRASIKTAELLAERENLQRWQRGIRHSTETHAPSLENTIENVEKGGFCPLDSLFSRILTARDKDHDARQKRLTSACQTLAANLTL